MEIVLSILDIIQDVSAVICGVLLLRTVGDYRERSRIGTVFTFICGILISVATSKMMYGTINSIFGTHIEYDDMEFYTVLISMAVWLISPLIILRVPQKCKSALLLFALVSIAELPGGILSLCIEGININEYILGAIEVLPIIVFYAVFIALLLVYSRKSNRLLIKNVFDVAPSWLYVLMFCISMFASFSTGLDSVLISNIVTIITVIGILCAIIWLTRRVGMLTVKQNEILSRLDEQQSGYEKMLKSDQQLREFRHDYKNHMLVVTALLNAGKTDEASDYLDKIKVRSGIVGRQFSTGNFVVDAILNNKNSLAEEFEIHIAFSGIVPAEGIENADLCTVVSNLVDNAIEGTKNFVGNKYIKVDASVRNGFLAISVANPVAKMIEIKNNKIKTTKDDSKNHGIGLRNVQRTAEKYGGVMLLSCSETEFSADVNMKIYQH